MRSLIGIGLMCASFAASAADNTFMGRYALTIPGGGAGWLGVVEDGGKLSASILWGGGSVVPCDGAVLEDGGKALVVTRLHKTEKKDAAGKVIATETRTETLRGTLKGDAIMLTRVMQQENGQEGKPQEFGGKRIPDLPPAPDLSKVKYGEPIQLLKGDSLDGWTLTNEKQKNGWKVANGVLVNNLPEHAANYGNLRTVQEFEDFNLKMDVNIPKGSNSGIYLRGIYEVQVLDSAGQPLDNHNMGAIYSRITPTVGAEKPAGEWQSLDITLVDRHVTVKLNDKMIIDNQALLGCTGGALTSDEFKPGPIYLQGDHGRVEYRNIVLTPVKK